MFNTAQLKIDPLKKSQHECEECNKGESSTLDSIKINNFNSYAKKVKAANMQLEKEATKNHYNLNFKNQNNNKIRTLSNLKITINALCTSPNIPATRNLNKRHRKLCNTMKI